MSECSKCGQYTGPGGPGCCCPAMSFGETERPIKLAKKTLGQIAYETFWGDTSDANWKASSTLNQARWGRVAQAVIAAYEAQKHTCSADTGPKPRGNAPKRPYGSMCEYDMVLHEVKVQS